MPELVQMLLYWWYCYGTEMVCVVLWVWCRLWCSSAVGRGGFQTLLFLVLLDLCQVTYWLAAMEKGLIVEMPEKVSAKGVNVKQS